MRAIFLLAPKARNHACCLLQRSIIIQVFITTIHVFVALVVMLLFSCSLFLHATNHSDNVAYLSFPSLMSLCCIWSVFSFFPYLHLHKHPSLSAFFQPAPSLLFLHVSNDRGIILLPLMAFRLPLSLSNDCSYLILPYPCSLSFSLSHYSSHSLPTPQVSLYATVSSAVFFFELLRLPLLLVSIFLLIDPASQGYVTAFVFIYLNYSEVSSGWKVFLSLSFHRAF